MLFVSYNVNGIRAAMRKDLILWIKELNPDVLCFQELKAQEDQIPIEAFENLGYHSYWHPAEKKGYSGVAILSKIKPDVVHKGMSIPKYDSEGRFIRADFGDTTLINTYHPSGTSGKVRLDFKLDWYKDFTSYISDLKQERKKIIICGDFNVAHKEIDIHDPIGNANVSGFLPEERNWMDQFLKTGFIDAFRMINADPGRYSWWSYRTRARASNKGWRIDYFVVTENLKNQIQNADILDHAVHSDHCPVVLEMKDK